MERTIAIIDLKSFYASCECAVRHLDPFTTPLVCCDPYRGKNSVVMSVTPYLKKHYGVPNVCRKKDLPMVKGMIYAQPRMSLYLQISARITSIFLDYVAAEDLHTYSVDESFLNLGPYMHLYPSAEYVVQTIQSRIYKELGIVATAGIGPNMFLAKTALDQEGKKKPPYIARWDYSDVPTKLWRIHPITKIWGINVGIASHLSRIGIRDLKGLATAPVSLLEKEFGVIGFQLHDIANGIDDCDMQERYVPKETSLTLGQTLRRGYSNDEVRLLLSEMVDELSYRMRQNDQQTGKVSLWIGYGEDGGFSKQRKLAGATSSPAYLKSALFGLLNEAPYTEDIHHISICFGALQSSIYEQVFLDCDAERSQKEEKILATLDKTRERYGANAIFYASALLPHSTLRERHEQIGGHRR